MVLYTGLHNERNHRYYIPCSIYGVVPTLFDRVHMIAVHGARASHKKCIRARLQSSPNLK